MPRKGQTKKLLKKQTGSNPPEKLVSSKVEITKSTHTASLLQYRSNVGKVTDRIKEFALKQSDNLLTVKMALMGAVRDVESMIRERRQ